MKNTLSARAAMLAVAIALASSPAFAHNVSVVGAGTIMLVPSADSLTLDTTSAVTGLGIFDFQAGTYLVGDSGDLNGPNASTVVEDVTIDGQTVALTLPYTNFVSNPDHGNLDNIQIMPAGPIHFTLAGVT